MTGARRASRPPGERLAAVEVRGDARVREARLRAHDGGVEAALGDHAGARHLHVADHAQAVHLRHQRAQVVREFLRQHRQHAAREVDGRRALARFPVEGHARADVVADIRDGDDEPVAGAARFREHRVVEVPGVLAVDRHERQARAGPRVPHAACAVTTGP